MAFNPTPSLVWLVAAKTTARRAMALEADFATEKEAKKLRESVDISLAALATYVSRIARIRSENWHKPLEKLPFCAIHDY